MGHEDYVCVRVYSISRFWIYFLRRLHMQFLKRTLRTYYIIHNYLYTKENYRFS